MTPDPRKARGRRYPWPLLLTLLAAGLASGHQTMRAIAQWVHLHADTLCAALPTLTTVCDNLKLSHMRGGMTVEN